MEQEKTLRALRTAIQMEIDGKAFYLKASEKSSNRLGRELLAQLASEEDIHRRKFEDIFRSIEAKRGGERPASSPMAVESCAPSSPAPQKNRERRRHPSLMP